MSLAFDGSYFPIGHPFFVFLLRRATRVSFIVPGKTRIEAVKDDPKDNKYLSAAVEGKADFIVSGDHPLKDLKIFHGIRILDPLAFLTFMTRI